MELSMKVVEQDKSQMVDALYARRRSASKGVPPALPASDITPSDDKQADGTDAPEEWVKFEKPILWMVAGKGPYVSRCINLVYLSAPSWTLTLAHLRSLMQFPVSHPDDGLIDISIQEVVCLIPTALFIILLIWVS